MTTEYAHNPETLKKDLETVENLYGTYDSDSPEYYDALENILRFAKWVHLGTDGKLEKDK